MPEDDKIPSGSGFFTVYSNTSDSEFMVNGCHNKQEETVWALKLTPPAMLPPSPDALIKPSREKMRYRPAPITARKKSCKERGKEAKHERALCNCSVTQRVYACVCVKDMWDSRSRASWPAGRFCPSPSWRWRRRWRRRSARTRRWWSSRRTRRRRSRWWRWDWWPEVEERNSKLRLIIAVLCFLPHTKKTCI